MGGHPALLRYIVYGRNTNMTNLLLKLAASLPVGDETRRALIKLAEAPKGKLKEFLDEVGDQKVINPVTKNKVKVKTLSTYPKESPAYKLFWDEYQRWLKEQDKKKESPKAEAPEGSQKAWGSRFSSLFQSKEDVEAWARSTQNPQREKWSEDEVEAVLSYTGEVLFEFINKGLRGGKFHKELAEMANLSREDPDFHVDNYTHIGTVTLMDQLFDSPAGKMSTEVVVKRGVGDNHPLYKMLEEGTLKEGYVFEDPAYQSTSAQNNNLWKGPAEILIKVPKGTPAVYLGGPPSKYSQYPEEYEVLLNRGSKLKITGFRKNPDPIAVFERYLIEAEVIVE